MTTKKSDDQDRIVIKKYANRRLYNTATSSYVTLDHLSQMVKENTDFVVYDAKSGEDITRPVLTQIIVEEENKGQNLLPISFLRQLIGFYGDSLQGLVPSYLEQAMRAFGHNQEQMREYMQGTMQGMFPFGQFEEMNKQNIALFEQTMKMFSPFLQENENGGQPGATPTKPTAPASTPSDASLNELKSQLEAMQAQLNSLAGGKSDK
ncbi:polyhydroxyalkanoate synthesis repressor PhaR [Thalassospira povalilytica]|uniref:polyhydroxyalkanoate synthesis repressor PhaR n=1 Tax=Thalassospira povalilytica TaxID=732237 RepID=UPI001D18077A|nr:polyhydroxyalkanoate synthesis repressor PhaR [Thalassospira povalilytica]MCC4241938.1 polyhydroxyalkanoate synthesis repressor PhaR [Thalassospira povalilytica]